MRARVLRQHEEWTPPLVRHGDVRQPRQGGASPGEDQGALSRAVEVVRTYLELRSPADLRPSRVDDPRVAFVRREPCDVDRYLRLYREVGERWYWRDRLDWSRDDVDAFLRSPNVALWECVVGDDSAGYFELARHE